MTKTINVELKKKTIQSAYNQIMLCNDLGFPNFQKGEPLHDLIMEIKKSVKRSIRNKKQNFFNKICIFPSDFIFENLLKNKNFEDFFKKKIDLTKLKNLLNLIKADDCVQQLLNLSLIHLIYIECSLIPSIYFVMDQKDVHFKGHYAVKLDFLKAKIRNGVFLDLQ